MISENLLTWFSANIENRLLRNVYIQLCYHGNDTQATITIKIRKFILLTDVLQRPRDKRF